MIELVDRLDGLDLALLGGALDREQLVSVINAITFDVEGGAGSDQVFTALGGNFDLAAGDDLFISSLDGNDLVTLVGSLDSSELVARVGSSDLQVSSF